MNEKSEDGIINSSLGSITQGASIHFIGKVISNILGFILNALLTRGLGATQYGLYAYGNTIITISAALARMGSGKAVLRFLPAYDDRPQRQNKVIGLAYLTSFLSGIFLGVILYVTAPLISTHTLRNPLLVDVIRVLAIVLPFNTAFKLTNAIFRAKERMEYLVLVGQILRPLSYITVVTIALGVGYLLDGVIFGIAVASVLLFGISLHILVNRLGMTPNIWENNEKDIKSFYNYSLPLVLKDVGQLLYKRVDIIMVGILLIESDVGIYKVGWLIAGVITLPLGAFNQIFPPVASRLYSKNNMGELNSVYKRITRWTLTIAIPPALIAVVYGQEILGIFGPEFTKGVLVLALFTTAQLTNCAVGPTGFLLMMTDHQYLSMLNQGALGILNIVLNYIFILRFGLIGAAIATGGVLAFINLLRVWEIWHLESLFPYNSKILKPVAAGIISGVIMYVMSLLLSGYILLISGIVLGCSAFVLLLYTLGIEEEDLTFFKNQIIQ
ncbi:flippase [Halobaculum roseum]|uniref:Flippase n=1 Tax=Halobaculum roseum TaxID=2175149 RepID=A0ABD5ML56_9EURY|nr:flippase [Halobaculum roseum]QZY03241.1 flippase [Halobaculum roseum]